MNKVAIVLLDNGEYRVYFGGYQEANKEFELETITNKKEGKPFVREITRIFVNESELVCWGRGDQYV